MNSASSGMVSKCVPVGGIVSQAAFEPTNRCATTSRSPASSSTPTDTQYQTSPRSGLGTGEPHLGQKSERKPVGRRYEATRARPASYWKSDAATISAALAGPPPCLRQSEQWHW